MVNLHARTEPHSRYAIFFIQSGGQVKNIVLNIILYTTQPQRILSFATRECAWGSIVRRIHPERDAAARHHCGIRAAVIVIIRKDAIPAAYTRYSQLESESRHFKCRSRDIRRGMSRRENARGSRNFSKSHRGIFIGSRRNDWRRLQNNKTINKQISERNSRSSL